MRHSTASCIDTPVGKERCIWGQSKTERCKMKPFNPAISQGLAAEQAMGGRRGREEGTHSVPSAVPQSRDRRKGQWDQVSTSFPGILRLFSSHCKGSHGSSRVITPHCGDWGVGCPACCPVGIVRGGGGQKGRMPLCLTLNSHFSISKKTKQLLFDAACRRLFPQSTGLTFPSRSHWPHIPPVPWVRGRRQDQDSEETPCNETRLAEPPPPPTLCSDLCSCSLFIYRTVPGIGPHLPLLPAARGPVHGGALLLCTSKQPILEPPVCVNR